jgi:hypothetical protein
MKQTKSFCSNPVATPLNCYVLNELRQHKMHAQQSTEEQGKYQRTSKNKKKDVSNGFNHPLSSTLYNMTKKEGMGSSMRKERGCSKPI